MLLTAVEGERLEAAIVCGLMLGLRPGELFGLPWSAIDFEETTLSVHQSLVRLHGNKLVIGAPKTDKSRRVLNMPQPVTTALKDHRQRQLAERLRGGAAWEDNGLVFPNELGGLMDPSNFRREFSKYTNKAGLGHWHPHEMRHSAASILAASGVPIQDVADVLGHATLRMTSEVYRHRITATADAAVAPMERLFSNG